MYPSLEIPIDTDIKDSYVDIGKEIRQLILLEMPAKPVCSDDCVGICKVCGRHNKKDDFCLCVDANDELIKQSKNGKHC